MAIPSTAAKRASPMLVVTFIAPEVGLVEAEEPLVVAVRSGTGDPVAVASTPPITGPLSGVYVQRSIDANNLNRVKK
jgi:hypothetical protein